MDVAEIAHEPETELARWTAEEFIELLDEGLIRDRRIELLDGLMVNETPQGPIHAFIFSALSRAFAAMGAYVQGLFPTITIQLAGLSVVEPEFTLLRSDAVGRFGTPSESDVLWVVEVSVTSRRKDLAEKRDAYAQAGIPDYWVFDAARRGTWCFSNPVNGSYADEGFFPEGGSLIVPVLGSTLETDGLFPPA